MIAAIVMGLCFLFGFLFRNGIRATGRPLVVLGSGGHTGEMLAILNSLDLCDPCFVYQTGDNLSVQRAAKMGFTRFYQVPRARNVSQSYLTSVYTTLYSWLCSALLVYRLRPQLILANGPASSFVLVLAAKILGIRARVVYIESLARVYSLSLSGVLVYYMGLCDRFLVQWPELSEKYVHTEYLGPLV